MDNGRYTKGDSVITDDSEQSAEAPVMKCEECQHDNPVGEVFCQQCNHRLGSVRPSARPNSDAATSRYRQIRVKCDEVQAGKITIEQFSSFLSETAIILTSRAQDILDNIRATSYDKENVEEVDMGLSGVDLYQGGINELWQFADDGDATHLETGLALIWDGNQRIIEAMRINRESREALALLWEQLQGP